MQGTRSNTCRYSQFRMLRKHWSFAPILSAMVSLVSFRFRRRASLELECSLSDIRWPFCIASGPGRAWLRQGDRLQWAWLYRAWPRCLKVMVLVKPATVIQWRRQGFRRYWRWRSCSPRVGRPGLNREIRDLIRQMRRRGAKRLLPFRLGRSFEEARGTRCRLTRI